MSTEEPKPAVIDGHGPAEPKPEIKAGDIIKLDPATCENLENCAKAAKASLIDIITMMPRGAEHMPLHVVLKVIAEITYAYWPPGVGPKVWDDGIRGAVHRMGQFTMMTPQAIANWKKEAEQLVMDGRKERGEVSQIIVPGGRKL